VIPTKLKTERAEYLVCLGADMESMVVCRRGPRGQNVTRHVEQVPSKVQECVTIQLLHMAEKIVLEPLKERKHATPENVQLMVVCPCGHRGRNVISHVEEVPGKVQECVTIQVLHMAETIVLEP